MGRHFGEMMARRVCSVAQGIKENVVTFSQDAL